MRHRSRGFTLIELVIVIVIISILAMVAVPKFISMTDAAKDAATKGSLKSMRSALKIFYAASASAGANPVYPSWLHWAMKDSKYQYNKSLGAGNFTLAQVVDNNITAGSALPAPNASVAWFYNSSTGQVWAANNTEW